MRLMKIENNTEIDEQEYLLDYIDLGEFFFLAKFLNTKSSVMITLTQNTVLEDLHEEYGGYIWYSKFCKTTFRLYESEEGKLYSRNMDEVMNWIKIDTYDDYWEGLILKSVITGKGVEELDGLDIEDPIVRWPNEKGGRGKDWYWLRKD
jgi:hypothetical protein